MSLQQTDAVLSRILKAELMRRLKLGATVADLVREYGAGRQPSFGEAVGDYLAHLKSILNGHFFRHQKKGIRKGVAVLKDTTPPETAAKPASEQISTCSDDLAAPGTVDFLEQLQEIVNPSLSGDLKSSPGTNRVMLMSRPMWPALPATGCQWAVGAVTDSKVWCGEAKRPGRQFCEHHCQMAYVKPPVPKKKLRVLPDPVR